MSKKQAKKKPSGTKKPESKPAVDAPELDAPEAVPGEDLADQALGDPAVHASIEEQLGELTTEEAEMFVRALELALKKRRWMLIGYLGALVSVVIGMVIALYVWGTHTPGTFVGWVFLLPPAMAGGSIWAAGWYVKRIGTKANKP